MSEPGVTHPVTVAPARAQVQSGPPRSRHRDGPPGPARLLDGADPVLVAALTMVAAQLAFRAWALHGSWFYLDDYSLLLDATRADRPGLAYLVEPWNSHLMPGGRLVAWLVAHSGPLNWTLAASLTLLLQLAASLAALRMLTVMFGRRWGILAPLGIYLFSAMTVPAFMWWTACLNQLAMQAGFFIAVAAWVSYLREKVLRHAITAYAGVALGLLFDVKALLVLPVLAYLAVAYFASGSLAQRLRHVVSTHTTAAVLGLVPTGFYVAYYSSGVSQPFAAVDPELAGSLAQSMLGTAFTSAAVGGPWRWAALAPPNAFADPPTWALSSAWVVVALTICYVALRRTRTGRAWALLTAYLLALLALVLTSRAPTYGDLIGLEYRYLTDAACVLALCVGLACMELHGSRESSAPRPEPLLRWRAPRPVLVGLVSLVCLGGVWSSLGAVRHWHHDNESDAYLHTLQDDLTAFGQVDLVDQAVPDEVYSAIYAPDNMLSRFTPLLSSRVAYPEWTDRLVVVGEDGGLRLAQIGPGTRSAPGPVQGCGWRLDEEGGDVPLDGRAFEWSWWLRVGYLSSADSPVSVHAGGTRVETSVQEGLGSLYVRVEGEFTSVRIEGLAPGATVCVDTVELGQPSPGAPLS